MEYIELKIQMNREYLGRTEDTLIADGFSSMMIDDPDDVRDIMAHPDIYRYDYLNKDLTEDLGRRPEITIWFSDDDAGREERGRAERLIRDLARESGGDAGISITSRLTGDDSEWLYKWQEHFKTTRVGERIVVRPGWEDYEPAQGELVIEMEPGMAFGSGLHETTSMCIRALEEILSAPDASRAHLLDVGTGTGILAIAGVLLGADEALGIDIDPDAVRVAEENIARNSLSGRISAQYGDLTEGVSYEADILVANLMADLVMKLSPAAFRHVKSGGWYITSGILDIKEEAVRRSVEAAGFRVEKVLSDGEWRAVIARRQ